MQVLWSEKLNYRALDQWTRELPIVAERGKITDRNGVILADNQTAYTVYARSNAVKEKEKTATLLAQTFGKDFQVIYDKLTKKKASEVTVAKRIDKEAVARLTELGLDGVYYSRDNVRRYPQEETLCQVLGFTSSDNVGTTGVEKYYEKYLAGKNGELLYETDLVGVDLEGSVAAYLPAESGYNVELTVDYGIQKVLESALQKATAVHAPKSAQGIVLDINTFEVLALANYPAYNLNEVPRNDAELLNKLTRNGLVSDVYEPGSTFKIITSAINVEEYLRGNAKAFSNSYVFPSSRTRGVDGTTVKCWSDHANGKHSNQTLAEALNNSCNPCFTDIALSLGKETFYEYLAAFGFGRQTGIDFNGEAYGLLMPKEAVRNCDLARIGFGQTVAVSGIQLACATASVINGGYYYTPRLVKRIYADDGYVAKAFEKELKRRTISEEASAILVKMLEGVVREGGGKNAAVEGYSILGKTGTAQLYSGGAIAAGKYVSSFIGCLSAENPQYLVLVIVNQPQGAYYGSVVAAPIAKEIFEGIIALKNIRKQTNE